MGTPIRIVAGGLIHRTIRYDQDYLDLGEAAYDRQFEARRLAALKQTAKSMGPAQPSAGQISGHASGFNARQVRAHRQLRFGGRIPLIHERCAREKRDR